MYISIKLQSLYSKTKGSLKVLRERERERETDRERGSEKVLSEQTGG